jgi:hypothetical protein
MYRPFRPTAISGHTRLTSGHTRVISSHKMAETYHAIIIVTIWKLGRTMCVYSMVQRREKEKDLRYIQEASAPAAVTVYQTYNIMYICNNNLSHIYE